MFIIKLDNENNYALIKNESSFISTQNIEKATRFNTRAVANKQIHDLGMRGNWPNAKLIKL